MMNAVAGVAATAYFVVGLLEAHRVPRLRQRGPASQRPYLRLRHGHR